ARVLITPPVVLRSFGHTHALNPCCRGEVFFSPGMFSFSELDEEIDFLSSVIAKQQESKVKPAENPSRAAAQPPTNQTTTPRLSSPTPLPPKTGNTVERRGPDVLPFPSRDTLLLILISACIIVGTIALILAAVCWIKLQRESRLAEKVDYQAFGSGKTVNDKTLAHSAQMYHYHHQKQQMISLEKHKEESKIPESGDTSDEENEGDFTVYECPGLAPTGEMEVRNPLFDDSTLHHQTSHK
uniref:Neural proliferation differentiation and control protein 1 n=1 Tax=Denticeps clupeoides TaxID=299321 RepID=A0AAY4E6J3_9TELE